MFWTKVECDGCNQKVRESRAIYHRGSYFCATACRDAWADKNPPLVAKGDPDKLKRDLVNTIDAAFSEYRTMAGLHDDTVGQAVGRMVPMLGKINAQHEAQERADASMRFIQYTYECVPLLNALGYRDEVAVLDSIKPGSGRGRDMVEALRRARTRAAGS